MRKALLSLFCLASSIVTMGQDAYIFTSFNEPSIDGLRYLYSYDALHWDTIPGVWMKPTIGNERGYVDAFTHEACVPTFAPDCRVLRDPSIAQGPDGTFHLVWTTQWLGSKGFGYAHSKDLINWSAQIEIPVMQDAETNNVWAPEIMYDDDEKVFVIIWSSMIAPEDYTEADKLGKNGAHRMWYTTTRDFRRFTPARRYYDPGFNSIDGFLLKRAKNDYVLISKDNRKPGFSNLFCSFSSSLHGPFVTADNAPVGTTPSVTFGREYSEGPCAIKVGDEWLIYFDQYRPTQEFGAVKTRDFKTFTPINDKISVPAAHKHGTIIKVSRDVLDNLLRHAGVRPKKR